MIFISKFIFKMRPWFIHTDEAYVKDVNIIKCIFVFLDFRYNKYKPLKR